MAGSGWPADSLQPGSPAHDSVDSSEYSVAQPGRQAALADGRTDTVYTHTHACPPSRLTQEGLKFNQAPRHMRESVAADTGQEQTAKPAVNCARSEASSATSELATNHRLQGRARGGAFSRSRTSMSSSSEVIGASIQRHEATLLADSSAEAVMSNGSASAQDSCIVTSEISNQGDKPQQQSPPAAASSAAEAEHDQEEKLAQLTRERDELKAELLLKATLNPSSEFGRILNGTDEGGKVLPCFCVHIHLSLFLSFSLSRSFSLFCVVSLSPLVCGHFLDVLAHKTCRRDGAGGQQTGSCSDGSSRGDTNAATSKRAAGAAVAAAVAAASATWGAARQARSGNHKPCRCAKRPAAYVAIATSCTCPCAIRAGVRNEETLLDAPSKLKRNHILSLTHMQMQSVTTIADVYAPLHTIPAALR